MKISVIIPTFNVAPYLRQTLESIRQQNYEPVEVILVDGGSTDGTIDVAAGFGTLISKTVVERDRGQLDALHKGLRIATGDVLYWINGDDIVMPGAFRYVAGVFQKYPSVDFIYSDDFAFDEEARALYVGGNIKGLRYLDQILGYRQMYSECVYWRREMTRHLSESDFDLRVYTDYAFFLNLTRGRTGKWVSKRLGAFRMRAGQNSAAYADKKAAELKRVRAHYTNELVKSPLAAAILRALYMFWFIPRQAIRPKIIAGARKVVRIVTNDRSRRALASFFFDTWLGCDQPESSKR